MKKSIAIIQSSYIPWKGYFDLINMVDELILYDSAQYTKNDWRNRNYIKTSKGRQWLTIPVYKEKLNQKIENVKVSDMRWTKKHWKSLVQNYQNAQFFIKYYEIFFQLYQDCAKEQFLSRINYRFIDTINKLLGIDTKIRWSSEFSLPGGRTSKILAICDQCRANVYLSGPSAREYFDLDLARESGIEVKWLDYSGYREYPQLYPPFEHGVTILDLIFNTGPEATKYMKSFR